jgi:hypothetical protein
MTTTVKLGVFGLVLVAVFAAALAAGSAVGPVSAADRAHRAASHGNETDMAGMAGMAGMPGMDHAAATVTTMAGMADGGLPQGLALSAAGYTLVPTATALAAGQPAPFSFRITGPDGRPVTAFTPVHDKELHLVVVRRDLAGYQHLHPARAPDGTWSMALTLPAPGAYKAFADFEPAGHPEMTLAVDLLAPGAFVPEPLAAPAATSAADAYQVALAGQLVAGQASALTFTVSRDGGPVTDLQPYLAAYGHLVALRVGDLAYLHVHPGGTPGDGHTPAGPQVTFHAEVPSPGAYRLFLEFKAAGTVHTAEFTVVAGRAAP